MKKYTVLFIYFFLWVAAAIAQPAPEYSIKNKKAIKKYEEAVKLYQSRQTEQARMLLDEAVQDDPNFIEAYLFQAQLFDEQGKTHLAIAPLEKAVAINPDFNPLAWMMLAECFFAEGNYERAEASVSKYMPYPKNDIQMERRSQIILSSCIFAKKAIQRPVPFNPINLGEGVNTELNEYYPCITADEKTLLFTRRLKEERAYQGFQEDFFIAAKQDSKWQQAQPIVSINTPMNEGAPSLSADGQTLIFTACENGGGEWGGNRQGVGSCDLFYSMRIENGWTPAKNLGSGINSGAWESQPSYSADGHTLYFVRGRRTASGIKEQDIYFSMIGPDGKWSIPRKIPGKVNTPFEEESVMIHPDGRTLYFSSNGHTGMGGLDIYMSRMLPNGDWDTPVNLGYPINTFRDENSFQVTARGEKALFASSRDGGFGGLDLYEFVLPEQDRPDPVTYVHGVVSDKLSYKKLEAHLELIDLASGKMIIESYSNQGTGEFLMCIPAGKDYALNVSKDGYLFHSENFSLKKHTGVQPFELKIALQKLRPGAKIVLKNIFFETNKYELKTESKAELDKLVLLLQSNPEKKVEIGGHTDNVGSDEANLQLSQNRANSVVEYLIKAGIPATRLTAKGYGETVPVADNSTEEGRAQNRRTEFTILE